MRPSPRIAAWAVFVLSLLGLIALTAQGLRDRGNPAPTATSGKPIPKPLAPLQAQPIESLGPATQPLAFIVTPKAATGPRPIHLVVPGRVPAEELCSTWQKALGNHFFVLCPRLPVSIPVAGSPPISSDYPDIPTLESRIREALQAAKARFGDYLDSGPISISGEGVAAERAVLLSRAEPSFFQRVLLLEGGYESWSPVQVQVFSEQGGRRVLFLCIEESCGRLAARPALMSRRFGVEGKVVVLKPGRDWDDPVELKAQFSWLVADDSRFSVLKKH